MSVVIPKLLLPGRSAPVVSQCMFTRAPDSRPRTVHFPGTWTDKIKRWRCQGQDKSEVKEGEDKLSGEDKSEKSGDPSVRKLEAALKVKEDKVKELEDKYLRALAETENVRQRMTKQIADAKVYGIHSFAKDLLEVADDLEKASASVSAEDLKTVGKSFVALVEGLKLTESELQKVLKKNGLTRIDGEGDKFDPAIHEAMFEVAGDKDKAGTVAVVSRHGYMLHERTLRPARVGVVKSS